MEKDHRWEGGRGAVGSKHDYESGCPRSLAFGDLGDQLFQQISFNQAHQPTPNAVILRSAATKDLRLPFFEPNVWLLEFDRLFFVPVCAFCPATANMTGEHIWPAWLSKLLPKTRYRNERISGEAKSTWTTTRLDQTANVVCKKCNETWMSELEGRAKSLLADVIINGKQTTFCDDDLRFLAAYAFEKSVIANYQTLNILPEPISTIGQRERFRTSLELPPDVRVWVSSFQGQARYSGRSNPRYARSTTDPPPLDDLDIYTHTYVIGHLVFQVLAYRFNSIFNRTLKIKLPKQAGVWSQACQQIWPIEAETITWPAKYLGPRAMELFVDRWFGKIPVVLVRPPSYHFNPSNVPALTNRR